jgi:hypothetical protein
MKERIKALHCCTWTLAVLALLALALTLFLWIGYPIIYTSIVRSQVVLKQYEDGQLSRSTFLWTRPPMNNVMNFYIYNITNVDDILYFGGKPSVHEIGPFAIREEENKRNYSFSADGETVWYQNYKTYNFDRSLSCPECDYNKTLWFPSLVGIGTLEEMEDPKWNLSHVQKAIIQYTMILLGEYPFVSATFGEFVFDGYAVRKIQ